MAPAAGPADVRVFWGLCNSHCATEDHHVLPDQDDSAPRQSSCSCCSQANFGGTHTRHIVVGRVWPRRHGSFE